jgi:hypothetical protein
VTTPTFRERVTAQVAQATQAALAQEEMYQWAENAALKDAVLERDRLLTKWLKAVKHTHGLEDLESETERLLKNRR